MVVSSRGSLPCASVLLEHSHMPEELSPGQSRYDLWPGRRGFRVTSTVSERLAGRTSRGGPNINHPPCAPRG